LTEPTQNASVARLNLDPIASRHSRLIKTEQSRSAGLNARLQLEGVSSDMPQQLNSMLKERVEALSISDEQKQKLAIEAKNYLDKVSSG
jgi:hypothetical protein